MDGCRRKSRHARFKRRGSIAQRTVRPARLLFRTSGSTPIRRPPSSPSVVVLFVHGSTRLLSPGVQSSKRSSAVREAAPMFLRSQRFRLRGRAYSLRRGCSRAGSLSSRSAATLALAPVPLFPVARLSGRLSASFAGLLRPCFPGLVGVCPLLLPAVPR